MDIAELMMKALRADKAFESQQRSGLKGTAEGDADAYRHMVWSGMMARDFGPGPANMIGNLHELTGLGQAAIAEYLQGKKGALEEAKASARMDMKNNMTGRGLAARPGVTDADIERAALVRILRGEASVRNP